VTRADASFLPRREAVGLAIDEETPYTYFHAYVAYRHGYRAIAVDSFMLARELLGSRHSEGRLPEEHPELVLEDIFLNYPDGRPGLSWLDEGEGETEGRATVWPRLHEVRHRIFVSSGLRLPGDAMKRWRNAEYIARLRLGGMHVARLSKPHAGLFDLWRRAGLDRRLRWVDPSTGAVHRGVARRFVWPPGRERFAESPHGHSSPGWLLRVAQSLIARAESLLLSGVRSVEDAVRGAVLAGDALELLGGRTATVAFQALRLKHRFEALCECQFSGVEYHFRLGERIAEVRRDVRVISRWVDPRKQTAAALNGEMKVLRDLGAVFLESGQFDEERQLKARERSVQHSLWMRARTWRYVFLPALRYAEFLLASVPRFVLSIAVWLLALTLLFRLLAAGSPGGATASAPVAWRESLSRSMESFLASNALPGTDPGTAALFALGIVVGLLHLGVFLSHFYSLMSRK
jgi:hypothetical protein